MVVEQHVENLVIFAIHRVAIDGLHLHVLTIGILLSRLLEFRFFGGELLDDLLDCGMNRRIEADVERCKAYAESSPSLGTSLTPFIGYEKAAALVKESIKTGRSIRDLGREGRHGASGLPRLQRTARRPPRPP